MKNTIFSTVHPTLVEFWKKHNLDEQHFYCRSCGKLMLDLNEIQGVEVIFNSKKNRDEVVKRLHPKKTKSVFNGVRAYIESPDQRWLIKGRDLSKKLFFRHTCWNCFFKHLKETVDIARKARKSTWYQKILNGESPIPISTTSPSKIFKLIFDITDEELENEHKKFDTASLEAFVRRHGEVDGRKKFEAYSQRQSYTCSKEYMTTEKGMTEQEWNDFNASRASTEENFIRRYGEELGKQKWKNYCAFEAYAGNTLTWFVEKLGKEEGTKRFEEVCRKKINTLRTYSFISQELFELVDNNLGDLAKESKWETKNFEQEIFVVDNGIKKLCKVDYFLGNKIIEFNGDFWHANPTFYGPDDLVKRKDGDKIPAKMIWEADAHRKELLESYGYKMLVVWENDFIKHRQQTVSTCIEFLKG